MNFARRKLSKCQVDIKNSPQCCITVYLDLVEQFLQPGVETKVMFKVFGTSLIFRVNKKPSATAANNQVGQSSSKFRISFWFNDK